MFDRLMRVLDRFLSEGRQVLTDRRLWLPPTLAAATAALAMLVPVACQARGQRPEAVETAYDPQAGEGVASASSGGAAPPAAAAALPAAPRPTLASEPTIRVFLQGGSRVDFTTLVAGRVGSAALAAGACSAEVVGGTLRVNGIACPPDCVIDLAAASGADPARFAAELTPPIGPAQRLRFAGVPVLHADHGRVQLIEQVPMETYLAGVLPVEMSPRWPVEALKAQAVAARSYASAHYLDRAGSAWQLHWHYTVDMAYGGCGAKRSATVGQALDATRGWVLETRGVPIPALFHACSGGRTESASNLWPDLRGADGRPIGAAMPVVADADANGGAAGLGLAATHWQWKADVRLADITSGLAGWTHEHPEARLRFGDVLEVRAAQRFVDSGRVATVAIRHRLAGKTMTTILPAQDFRMAVGPGVVRSTWWDRCVMAGAKGGTLVLAGRGFGHGVGLSQVSAWKMAKDGLPASTILARFYPTADLVRAWP